MTRANAKWIRLMAVIGCTTMWDGILQTCTGCTDESILRDDESFYGKQRADNPFYSATIRGRQI